MNNINYINHTIKNYIIYPFTTSQAVGDSRVIREEFISSNLNIYCYFYNFNFECGFFWGKYFNRLGGNLGVLFFFIVIFSSEMFLIIYSIFNLSYKIILLLLSIFIYQLLIPLFIVNCFFLFVFVTKLKLITHISIITIKIFISIIIGIFFYIKPLFRRFCFYFKVLIFNYYGMFLFYPNSLNKFILPIFYVFSLLFSIKVGVVQGETWEGKTQNSSNGDNNTAGCCNYVIIGGIVVLVIIIGGVTWYFGGDICGVYTAGSSMLIPNTNMSRRVEGTSELIKITTTPETYICDEGYYITEDYMDKLWREEYYKEIMKAPKNNG